MNKFLFTFLLMLSIRSSYAQARQETKWGFSFALNSIQSQVEVPLNTGPGAVIIDADGNILTGGARIDNSISLSLIPKYSISENFLLRFEIGFTNLNLKASSDQKSSSTRVKSHTEISSKINRYSFGLQWYFMKTRTINSYFGIAMNYSNYGKLNRNLYYEYREISTDTLQYWGDGNEVTAGGFSGGIGSFAGFNIYIKKWFSVGAELSSSANYYNLGGVTTGYSIQQSLPNPLFTNTSTYTNSYKGFKISKIMSSYNISFWF